jgi:nucleotide-binding universal stress UspA family protein
MHNFHNILYVGYANGDETEGLKQALSLARNNQAPLTVLIMYPKLPDSLGDYKKAFEDSLVELAKKSVQATRRATLKLGEAEPQVTIKVESGDTPAIRIIQHVLRDAHDLVVKEAEPKEGGKGFKAMDMELLRKCPCPVWLCRPIAHHRGDIRVAVAIDPESMEQVGHDLSLRLLQLSQSLADTCSGELSIVSCWVYEYEESLRHNVWIKVSEEELIKTLMETQAKHRAALERVIRESAIGGKYHGKYHVHHIKGIPDQMIPSFIESEKVDILVMGTLARTGIHSFIIGNTAENIVQKLGCSLLALKPNGFVSPVKAY